MKRKKKIREQRIILYFTQSIEAAFQIVFTFEYFDVYSEYGSTQQMWKGKFDVKLSWHK